MLIINDNKGIIRYTSVKNLLSYFSKEQTKGWRQTEDSQHDKGECHLTLKIAKLNYNIDPKNEYYKKQLEMAENNFKLYKNENKSS